MPILRLHSLMIMIYWTFFRTERDLLKLYTVWSTRTLEGTHHHPTKWVLLQYLGLSLWAYLIFTLVQHFNTELSVVRDTRVILGKPVARSKKNQVGSNSSISIDRMLSPVEIVHLTIISRVYYIYLDTINGTNNFTDVTITKFTESNCSLCCFALSFRKYYQVRSHLCHTLAFKFTYNFNSHWFCNNKIFCNRAIAAFCCQPPQSISCPFLYWNCLSELCVSLCNERSH